MKCMCLLYVWHVLHKFSLLLCKTISRSVFTLRSVFILQKHGDLCSFTLLVVFCCCVRNSDVKNRKFVAKLVHSTF